MEQSLDDEGDDDRTIDVEVDVWPCHEPALDVFRHCQLLAVGTFGGVFWLGIAGAELRAALALRRVPRRDWIDVGDDVHFMGDAVAAERNRRAEHRARRK